MSVDVLVIVGGNKAADIEAMKAIYGPSATIRTVRNADDLVAAIKSNSPMRRLVIATHGSEGDVVIGGVHTSIKKLASSIQASAVRPRVREAVIFDGCNVAGGESEGLVEFMESIGVPLLQAFTTARLWWSDDYLIPKGSDSKALAEAKKRYDFVKEYQVANQLSWDDLVTKGRGRIWCEGFSRTLRRRPTNDGEKRAIAPRSRLEIVRVAAKDIRALAARTGRPGGPMMMVEIRRPVP
jgi:hypothetical protein